MAMRLMHLFRYTYAVPLSLLLLAGSAQSQNLPPAPDPKLVGQYCATCHSERLKTGGLVLDPAKLSDLGANAELWEKVARKLQANAMPPPGAPRPAPDALHTFVTSLENGLDRAAALHVQPGKLPLLHRLSRTEYQNAIRDLLGLDYLPKEVDISFLLPADNISSGFDNIA